MASAVNNANATVPLQTKAGEPVCEAQRIKNKPAFLQDVRIMQAIAIIFVVFAHSVIPGHRFTGVLEFFDRFIRATTVPLFICVSGYLYHYSGGGSKPAVRFLRERVYRLLWPYFCLSTLAFLIKANLGSLASRTLAFTPAAYFHQLFYPWDNAIIFFWYLPTLMLICVASVFIDRWIVQRHPPALLVVLVVLVCISTALGVNETGYIVRFLNLFGALSYLLYFWIGFALSKYHSVFASVLSGWGCFAFLLACFVFTISHPNADHGLHVFEASTASIALLASVKEMSRWRQWHTLSIIGDNAYQIYLLSWFFQTLPIILFSELISRNQYVCALASLILGMAGPILVVQVVRRQLPAIRSSLGLR